MSAASADLRSLAADLAYASGEGIARAAAETVRSYAGAIQQLARQYAPVSTGRLRDSIIVTFTSATQAVIGPTVDYGAYQEFGTGSRGEFPGGPYVIRPRNARALAFKVDGHLVVTKEVHHPGVPPVAYMRRATVAALDPMAAELAERGALLVTLGPRAAS